MDNDQYQDEENVDNDQYLDEEYADADQYSDEENANNEQYSNEESGENEEPKPKKSKWPLWVIIITIVVAGGTAAAVFAFSSNDKARKAADAHNKKTEETKNATGPLVEMRPLVVNLTDPDVDKYAKVAIFVEANNEESKTIIENSIIPMRSRALLYLSSISSKDAFGAEKKIAISEHMKVIFEKVIGKKAIKQVHFGEFVIQ
jgi:flagellar basal body-associated protein FliL